MSRLLFNWLEPDQGKASRRGKWHPALSCETQQLLPHNLLKMSRIRSSFSCFLTSFTAVVGVTRVLEFLGVFLPGRAFTAFNLVCGRESSSGWLL